MAPQTPTPAGTHAQELDALAVELLELLVGLRPHGRERLAVAELAAMTNADLNDVFAALGQLRLLGLVANLGMPGVEAFWSLRLPPERTQTALAELKALVGWQEVALAATPRARTSGLAERCA